MATNDVRLTYIADISSALSGMNSVEKATRAQIAEVNRASAALSSFDRAQKKIATGATGKLNPALNQTRAAATNLQAQFFDIGVGLQGGQNPFTILSQQGPQIAQAMMQAGGGVNALKVALLSMAKVVGPVAAVVGLGVAAWKAWTEESDRANRMTERGTALQLAMQPVLRDTEGLLIDVREARGELTATEATHIRNTLAGLNKWQSATAETRKEVEELQEGQTGFMATLADFGDLLQGAPSKNLVILGGLIDGVTKSSDEAGAEIAALNQNLLQAFIQTEENAQAANDLADARRNQAAATRAATEAERAHLALVAGVKASNDEFIADLLERGARLDANAAKETQMATDALAQVRAEKAERQAAAEALQAQAISAGVLAGQQAQQVLAISGEVASRLGASAQAQAAFAKSAAVLGVAVNTSAAIVRSMAILGPPVPPNFIGIAGVASAAAIGAAQAGLIASQPVPSFGDTPGPVFAGPRGMTASFAPGDMVIAARTRDGLQSQASTSPGTSAGQPIEVTQRYRHRAFNAFVADNIRQPGSPLATALRTPTTHATRG